MQAPLVAGGAQRDPQRERRHAELLQSIRARHAAAMAEAGFFGRLLLRWRIAAEFRRERRKLEPSPHKLYGRAARTPQLVALLVLLPAVLLGAPWAAAADWYVDANYADCPNSTGSAAQPFCTIQEAIKVAATGDTIHIAPGTYTGSIKPSVDLQFVGTQGAAVTILDLNRRILEFTDRTIRLTGLQIANRDADFGHAISAVRSDLTMEDCIVQNCKTGGTSSTGSALSAEQSVLHVTNCDFLDNANHGQNTARGAAMYLESSSITLDHCRFERNIATSGSAIEASDSVLEIWDSSFADNFGYPAGVLDLGNCTVRIRSCSFSNNDGGFSPINIGLSTLEITDSSFEDNAGALGGAMNVGVGDVSLLRCTFRRNTARLTYFSYNPCCGNGGAICASDVNLSVADCLFESNVAEASGGALYMERGTVANLDRCRLLSNTARSAIEALGGGIAVFQSTATIRDCEFANNVANSFPGTAGRGGGLYADGSTTRLERCSFGGNSAIGSGASSGGLGGGLSVESGAVVELSHVVLAENFGVLGAPDLSGTATTLGYNVLGDSTGATLIGAGPADLVDVDPLFTDATNGDLRLLAGSPCIDSGDPAFPPGGADAVGAPRVLDGNLDRQMVLDRGALEFGHVRLDVSGDFVPGGAIQLDTTGTNGLPVFLFAGIASAELVLDPFGSLFVDLGQLHLLQHWGTIPSTVNTALPADLPQPLTLFVQEIAFAPPGGNFSNLVRIDVR